MTNKEMLEMRINGATFQEIADICGMSRQNVYERIKRYSEKYIFGKRGHYRICDEIIYEGIYDYFMQNENETITSFTRKILGHEARIQMMRSFLMGANESRFTINQIKKMCEIVGKPFEEVFEEREQVDR